MFHFNQVSKNYRGTSRALPVLHQLTLHIPRNQFLCVLGPSGCGKTTLLNLAAGFIRPSQGQVLFAGRAITAPGPQRGVVFQDAGLFPWLTTLENVCFGLRQQGMPKTQREALATTYLHAVGIARHANAWPAALSGGMRQRVAIARILALQPEALLMDEPFSALDANSREHLQDLLLELWQARRQTIVYITHSVEEAAYLADRVLILGPAPNTIHADICIDLARPRCRCTAEFQEVVGQLRGRLNQLPCCMKPLPFKEEF